MNEVAFKELISGRRRGSFAALQCGGLSVLSWLYGLGSRLRNRAFDISLKKVHRAGVPVISIGNITTGGTGKTPLVAWVANRYRERGVPVALISRGYRSLNQAEVTNDEKLVLDTLCPGVPHVQNPDRVAAAESAVNRHNARLLILDDGFQHRRLHRDLDIVLVDALCPFGFDRLLPRGLLRESLTGLRRADIIILTRADQCTAEDKQRILETIKRHTPDCPVAEVAFRPESLVKAGERSNGRVPLSTLHGEPVVAFCGIGNPESFRRTISDCDIRDFHPFPDHYHYRESDLTHIGRSAATHNAAAVLTTLKDLVKINHPQLGDCPLWALQIVPEFQCGQSELEGKLDNVLRQPTTNH